MGDQQGQEEATQDEYGQASHRRHPDQAADGRQEDRQGVDRPRGDNPEGGGDRDRQDKECAQDGDTVPVGEGGAEDLPQGRARPTLPRTVVREGEPFREGPEQEGPEGRAPVDQFFDGCTFLCKEADFRILADQPAHRVQNLHRVRGRARRTDRVPVLQAAMPVQVVRHIADEVGQLLLPPDVADRQADAALVLEPCRAPGRRPDVQGVLPEEPGEVLLIGDGRIGPAEGRQPAFHFRRDPVQPLVPVAVEVEVADQPELPVLRLPAPEEALWVPVQVNDAEGGEVDNAGPLKVVPSPRILKGLQALGQGVDIR